MEDVFSTRQNFMNIGLVTHIPNQSVFWSVKHIVQCKCQFHHSQTGPQMPFFSRQHIDDKSPQLFRQYWQLRSRNLFEVLGIGDVFQ